jgi:hypothetical protein
MDLSRKGWKVIPALLKPPRRLLILPPLHQVFVDNQDPRVLQEPQEPQERPEHLPPFQDLKGQWVLGDPEEHPVPKVQQGFRDPRVTEVKRVKGVKGVYKDPLEVPRVFPDR